MGLQQDVENAMDGVRMQHGRLKENGNKKDNCLTTQNETIVISRKHNEELRLVKFDTQCT